MLELIPIGLDILSKASSALKEYERNVQMKKLLGTELPEIEEAKKVAGDIFGQRTELLGAQRGAQYGELEFKAGQNIFDLMSGLRSTGGRAGFAGFGALESAGRRGIEDIQTGYEYGRQSIFDVFSEKQLNTLIDYQQMLSDLERQKRSIETQMASLDTKKPGFLTQVLGSKAMGGISSLFGL